MHLPILAFNYIPLIDSINSEMKPWSLISEGQETLKLHGDCNASCEVYVVHKLVLLTRWHWKNLRLLLGADCLPDHCLTDLCISNSAPLIVSHSETLASLIMVLKTRLQVQKTKSDCVRWKLEPEMDSRFWFLQDGETPKAVQLFRYLASEPIIWQVPDATKRKVKCH